MKNIVRSLICLLMLPIPCSTTVFAWNASNESVTIAQFGQERFLLYLPLYIAMEEGIFQKHGLDVDLRFAGNDDQVFASVISGNVGFGVGDPVFTAISHDKGGPGKVVAMMLTSLGVRGVAAPDSSIPVINTPADLNGLRVSSLPDPSTTFNELDSIKRNNHLDNMQIVQGAFGAQMALLESKQVDIATDLEPTISMYIDKGYRPVLDLTPWFEPQAITGVMTTEEIIKNHPQTVQKLVDSLQEAVNKMYSDPQVSYRVAQKIYPQLPSKVVHSAVDALLSRNIYPHSVVVDSLLWQRTIKTRLDSGEIKKPQTTDIAVDNTFALRAEKALGTGAK